MTSTDKIKPAIPQKPAPFLPPLAKSPPLVPTPSGVSPQRVRAATTSESATKGTNPKSETPSNSRPSSITGEDIASPLRSNTASPKTLPVTSVSTPKSPPELQPRKGTAFSTQALNEARAALPQRQPPARLPPEPPELNTKRQPPTRAVPETPSPSPPPNNSANKRLSPQLSNEKLFSSTRNPPLFGVSMTDDLPTFKTSRAGRFATIKERNMPSYLSAKDLTALSAAAEDVSTPSPTLTHEKYPPHVPEKDRNWFRKYRNNYNTLRGLLSTSNPALNKKDSVGLHDDAAVDLLIQETDKSNSLIKDIEQVDFPYQLLLKCVFKENIHLIPVEDKISFENLLKRLEQIYATNLIIQCSEKDKLQEIKNQRHFDIALLHKKEYLKLYLLETGDKMKIILKVFANGEIRLAEIQGDVNFKDVKAKLLKAFGQHSKLKYRSDSTNQWLPLETQRDWELAIQQARAKLIYRVHIQIEQ
jgi:hypothetical protein